jgi:DNA topoisomerase-1
VQEVVDEKKPEPPKDDKADDKAERKVEGSETLTAQERSSPNGRPGQVPAKNEEEATGVLGGLMRQLRRRQGDAEGRRPATPPFTTSTLQQRNFVWDLDPSNDGGAQALYQAWTSAATGRWPHHHMRTDSTRISDDALTAVRDHIQTTYGPPYLPAAPNRYASGKGAQEARRSARRTWRTAGPRPGPTFRQHAAPRRPAQAVRVDLQPLRRLPDDAGDPGRHTVDVEATCPARRKASRQSVSSGPVGQCRSSTATARDAPGRQGRGSRTAAADREEKLDLLTCWRRSTSRSRRRYARRAWSRRWRRRASAAEHVRQHHQEDPGSQLRPSGTPLLRDGTGHADDGQAHQALRRRGQLRLHLRDGEELDQIEERKLTLKKVMNDFYVPFSKDLEKAKTEMEETAGVPTGENCPQCNKPLVIKYSRKRQGHQFIGCSGYPECKYIKPEEGRVRRCRRTSRVRCAASR